MPTVNELFQNMPASFQSDAAVGLDVAIQFDITGEGGGTWYAAIKDGALDVVPGAHPSPNLTITVGAKDYVDISTGALNEQLAFMTGRITARGDTALAMKLPRIFTR